MYFINYHDTGVLGSVVKHISEGTLQGSERDAEKK